MFKVMLLLKRREGLSAADFTHQWRMGAQAEADRAAPGLLRQVHNRPLGDEMPIENAPPAPFDGVDEYWFADAAAALAHFTAHWPVPREALLGQPVQAMGGTPRLVWERPAAPAPDAVKIITLPVRRAGMTLADFDHHWVHVHSGLALQGPQTRERLQRLEPCPRDEAVSFAAFAEAPFDGAGTIEFASRADLQAEFAGAHYREVMAPDEPRFTDPSRSAAMMVAPMVLRR
jgi:hypothetical protein